MKTIHSLLWLIVFLLGSTGTCAVAQEAEAKSARGQWHFRGATGV